MVHLIFLMFLYIEGKLIKHGFARIATWKNDPVFEENGDAVCKFYLESSEWTKSYWNYDFLLTYVVRVNATTFSSELM